MSADQSKRGVGCYLPLKPTHLNANELKVTLKKILSIKLLAFFTLPATIIFDYISIRNTNLISCYINVTLQ